MERTTLPDIHFLSSDSFMPYRQMPWLGYINGHERNPGESTRRGRSHRAVCPAYISRMAA